MIDNNDRYQMVIVGGSAFILLGKLTRATHDIDALSVPKELYGLLGKYDINTDVERGKAVRTEQDVSVSAGDTQRSSDMIGCQGDGKLLIRSELRAHRIPLFSICCVK